MVAIDLEAIEARANAATPGSWRVGRVETTKVYCRWPWGMAGPSLGERVVLTMNAHHPEPGGADTGWHGDDPQWAWNEDAIFIAHAREDIPALVAEVRRLREFVKGV